MKKYLIGGNDYTTPNYIPQKIIKCNIEINGKKFPASIINAELGIDAEVNYFGDNYKKLVINAEVDQNDIVKAINTLVKATDIFI